MYPIPPTETLVETKTCRHCQASFPITDKDMEFYDKISPVFNDKKYSIPTPTICPDCRQQRRLSFRNERKLYKRKCSLTGKDIISIYSPDKPYTVYEQSEWWSDKWDPMDYGRYFDFSRGFFEQFGELQKDVPEINFFNEKNENSPYANYSAENKNVHLVADIMGSEDVYFANTIKNVKNSMDLTDVEDSENCYECYAGKGLYECSYLYQSQNCIHSIGLFVCKNVSHSLFCTNLINKEYFIFNEKSSKESYEALKNACKNRTVLLDNLHKFRELILKSQKKHLIQINTEDVIGDNLYNSQHCLSCFEGVNIQDCRYCVVAHSMNDCMDTTIHNPNCFLDYEGVCGGELTNSQFNVIGWDCQYVTYCSSCTHSSHLFGCIGLRNKQYCILNKQYTKEEYETLVPKIIEHMKKAGEWGEFFPASLSPFGYNETVAQEYYPLTREEVVGGGRFKWSDYEAPFPRVEKVIPANKLPDNIHDIPDDILNWAIECEVTGKPFRIIKQELEFYRKHSLPIPRRHPDQRHLDRMSLRNPRKLFKRKCDKCGVEIMTTYAPERPEVVYCESCYNKVIY